MTRDNRGYTKSHMATKADYTDSNRVLSLQRQNQGVSPEVARQNEFLRARLPRLAEWVTNGLRPEALIRFALADMTQNPKLAACDPQSIYLGLLACAVCGLEPGSLKNEAYLVPFGGKAQFMPGYRGMLKMMRRSGEVVGCVAHVVHEHDTYEMDLGTANSITFRPALRDRGAIIGAFGIATLKDGHQEIEWVDISDLDCIRKVAESRGKSPAWQAWPEEMMRKSVIRRMSKRLPMGSDFHAAIALETSIETKGDQREVLDVLTDGGADEPQGPRADDFAFDPEKDGAQ